MNDADDVVVFDPVSLIGRLRIEAAKVERLRNLVDRILDYSAYTHAQQIEWRRLADAAMRDAR